MVVIKKFRITKYKNPKPLISLKNISLSFKKNHLILDNISLLDMWFVLSDYLVFTFF